MSEFKLKEILPSALISIILPVLVYLLLKYLNWSDTAALAIATGFPLIEMLFSLIKSGKINPISLVSVVGFLISLLAVYLAHGNNLAFKIWQPILTSLIGLVLLGTVAFNRPLLELSAEEKGDVTEGKHTLFMLGTAYWGLVFVLHAILTFVIAFSISTTAYVIGAKVIDILAIILLAAGFYVFRKKLKKD